MFRASSILKNARLDKDLTIDEVAKKLKISPKYLSAIESEDQKNFPSEPYCSLIVKDYGNFLGLKGEEILRFFHRDFDPKRPISKPTKKLFGITPQLTFTISVIALVAIFTTYLVSEYFKFNQPPHLKVNWPTNISTSQFEITGQTDPEATVRVNQDLVIVDPQGNFKKRVNLTIGDNQITIESKSPGGKTTSETKNLILP